PWMDATAKVICDTRWGSGSPIEAAPRHVLARILAEANAMGYDVCYAHELEFYLLDAKTHEPLFGGLHIFNTLRNNYAPFLNDVIAKLQAVGIDVITHNCEYAPSQFEIVYGPAFGIAGADKAFTFKNAIKELAHRAGYLATFMSKPATTMSGSGCHVHISLIDRQTGKNAFVDPRAPDVIPDSMRHFTQGILDHARAMMALIGPTPNCYRRLRPHTFAPSNVSWGEEDRSAMVRLKHVGMANAHVEMRAASGLSNPYLSAAATLAAGLLGLKAKRSLQPEVSGPSEDDPTLSKLPATLDEALESLEANSEMRAMVGDPFVHVFTKVKRHELARFHAHVSDWERSEYLEIF
ncbi:MAG: glutamine synthetase, partial [Alphaproteobacteria bacterium]|nr:glutamine synthetase [Alphaproteobacteria bacterium]